MRLGSGAFKLDGQRVLADGSNDLTATLKAADGKAP
jgi:hypothetical protein